MSVIIEKLSDDERVRLDDLEGIIDKGMKTFIEVGTALGEIRDSRLYREEYDNFESYCSNRWGMLRDYANKLIRGANLALSIAKDTIVSLTNEGQLRELSGLTTEEATNVVNRAASMLRDGEKLTAFLLKEVREDYEYERYVQGSGEDGEKSDTKSWYASSESQEWYTPAEYIEAARSCMGGIDLDPASCEYANGIVKAEKYYDINDDGLDKPWFGRVFANPPYGRNEDRQNASNQGIWAGRFVDSWESGEIATGILLCNSSTSEQWFAPLWRYVLCFTDHRIRCYNEVGEALAPVSGSAFVYFGDDEEAFIRHFSKFGPIVRRIG